MSECHSPYRLVSFKNTCPLSWESPPLILYWDWCFRIWKSWVVWRVWRKYTWVGDVYDKCTQVWDSRSLRLMLGLVFLMINKVLVWIKLEKLMSDKQSKGLLQNLAIYITFGLAAVTWCIGCRENLSVWGPVFNTWKTVSKTLCNRTTSCSHFKYCPLAIQEPYARPVTEVRLTVNDSLDRYRQGTEGLLLPVWLYAPSITGGSWHNLVAAVLLFEPLYAF